MTGNLQTARAIQGREGSDGCGRARANVQLGNDLERRILNVLRARCVPGLVGLELSADGGQVVLKGILPSPRAQWLCVECCRHVPGVIAVVDLTSVDAIDTLIEVR
jgi:hypothetical protein